MREILFRGKMHGKWYEGIPFFKGTDCFLIQDVFQCDEYFCIGTKNVEVIPETVGQYTGLTDKNGTKIFEGDIVNVFTETTRYVVKFDEWRCGWYPFASGDGCGCCETHTHPPNYAEVIGNIHDNPELMEGGNNYE